MAKLNIVLRAEGLDKDMLELQERQLKQMLYEIMTEEPFIKPLVSGAITVQEYKATLQKIGMI